MDVSRERYPVSGAEAGRVPTAVLFQDWFHKWLQRGGHVPQVLKPKSKTESLPQR